MTRSEEEGAEMTTSGLDDAFDDGQVITTMRDAVRDVDRPTSHLVRAAIRRGRRRRRLTRIAEAASAVAISGAVIVIVFSISAGHTTDRAAASKSPAVSTAPTHQHSSPSNGRPQSDAARLTPNVIILRALQTSPIDGTFTHYADRSKADAVGAAFTFNNVSDAAEITIVIRHNDPAIMRCPQNAVDCRRLANGTIVTHQITGAAGHPSAIMVTSHRGDGTEINVAESPVRARTLFNLPNGRELWVDEAHLAAWADASVWTTPVSKYDADRALQSFPITGR